MTYRPRRPTRRQVAQALQLIPPREETTVKFYDQYILDGHTPVQEPDMDRYLAWKRANPEAHRVAQTTLPNGRWVSTVFLHLNHAFGGGPPVLFETMVFADEAGESLAMNRYCTWDEAERGHAAMVAEWTEQDPAPQPPAGERGE